MKKAAKISAVILAGAILLSCSACSQGNRPSSSETSSLASESKPYTIYLASTQKTNSLKSADADFTVDMTMDMSGTTISMKSTGNTKAVTNGSDAQFLVHSNTQMLGQTFETDYYFADGYAYISVLGQKIKQKMDLSTFKKTTQNQSILSNSFSEKGFENASVTKSDGETSIKAKVPKEEMQSFFDSYIANAMKGLGSGSDMNIQYSDIDFEITVNADGYVQNADATCTVTFSVDAPALANPGSNTKTDVKMNMSVKSTYNNPGQDVTITPPSDMSEYKESDSFAGAI